MVWRSRSLGAAVVLASAVVVAAAGVGQALVARVPPALQRQLSAGLGAEVRWAGTGVTPQGWLVLREVRVTPPQGPALTVPRLLLQSRWLNLLVRREILREPVQFILEGPGVLGLPVRLEGTYAGGTVSGRVGWGLVPPLPVAAHLTAADGRLVLSDLQLGNLQAVSGVVDLGQRQWRLMALVPTGGVAMAQGPLSRLLEGDVVLRDVKAGPVTVSTTVHLAAAWTAAPPGLEGTVTTTGSAVNRQPISELSGTWRVAQGRATIREAAVGPRWRVSGSVGWTPPYPMELAVDAADVDAARVAALIEPGKTPLAGGIVRGRIAITGSAAAPHLHGALTARNGKLGATPYDAADVQFDGEGTVIRFLETQLWQPDAVVAVSGFLDVTKLGTPTVFQDMRLTSQPLRPPREARIMALNRARQEGS